jgi:CRISPR-associated exonuclease Cas4
MSRRAAPRTAAASVYSEDELLPLSALQHVIFCERQFALIHIEQLWAENRLTVEGKHLHDRVHDAGAESRGDLRIVRGLRLRNLRLGLLGIADVVEFHRQSDGSWLPFPVEYKRGKPKKNDCDRVQLCAQAMCLEEMLGQRVAAGALFYGTTRHRLDVIFDETLRAEVSHAAARAHELFASGHTPAAVYEPKCDNCSLFGLCMPKKTDKTSRASRYVAGILT